MWLPNLSNSWIKQVFIAFIFGFLVIVFANPRPVNENEIFTFECLGSKTDDQCPFCVGELEQTDQQSKKELIHISQTAA